jgi:thioredoxin reductase
MAEHDLQAAAFPKLDEAQLASLGRCPLTKLRRFRAGEKLFEAGTRDCKFYVIKFGEVEVVNNKSGEQRTIRTPAVFSFIGAVSRTDWLPPEIEKDPKGLIRTGPAVAQSPHWRERRQPYLLETSRRGVFAAGDVRSGSVKRVASAVGEGAMAVQLVHEYLKEM